MFRKNVKKSSIFLISFIFSLIITVNSVDAKSIPQTYTITNAHTYEITYRFKVENTSYLSLKDVDIEIITCSAYDKSPYFQITSDLKVEGGQTIIENSGLEKAKINIDLLNPYELKTIILRRKIK